MLPHSCTGGWIHIALLSPNQATEGIYTTEYMKTKQRQIFANLPKYSFILYASPTNVKLFTGHSFKSNWLPEIKLAKTSSGTFDLLFKMIIDPKRSIDLRCLFDDRCYIHLRSYSPGTLLNPISCRRLSC